MDLIKPNSKITCTTPVLLVCVINKKGTLLGHDFFYRIFSQYKIIKKVWGSLKDFDIRKIKILEGLCLIRFGRKCK